MRMGEIHSDALGVTDEHYEVMDELIPGWRDLTMREFADELAGLRSELQDESSALRRMIQNMDQEGKP